MRTVVACKKGSSFFGGKTHFSTGYPDTTMALSDLLQIQRCKLNIIGSIQEEQSGDMDMENVNVRLYDAHINDNNNKFVKDIRNNSNEDDILSKHNSNNVNDTVTSDIYNLNTSAVKENECEDVDSSTCQEECDASPDTPKTTQSSLDEPWSFKKQQGQQRQTMRSQSEVKSGHLVFIVSDQNPSTILPNPKCSRPDGSKFVFPTRFPVIVKVHRKSCERYAIISLTKNRQSLPSVFLRLKRSRVTQSTTNPCRFVVIVDGTEGKSLTFEASSTESALEWMEAFSSDSPPSQYPALSERQLSGSSDLSSTSSTISAEDVTSEKSQGNTQSTISELNAPTPSLKLPSSPFLPVLSESFDEEEEENE